MKWFGPDSESDKLIHMRRVAVPIGHHCFWCDKRINPNDAGFMVPHLGNAVEESGEKPHHRDCLLENLGLKTSEGAQ